MNMFCGYFLRKRVLLVLLITSSLYNRRAVGENNVNKRTKKAKRQKKQEQQRKCQRDAVRGKECFCARSTRSPHIKFSHVLSRKMMTSHCVAAGAPTCRSVRWVQLTMNCWMVNQTPVPPPPSTWKCRQVASHLPPPRQQVWRHEGMANRGMTQNQMNEQGWKLYQYRPSLTY